MKKEPEFDYAKLVEEEKQKKKKAPPSGPAPSSCWGSIFCCGKNPFLESIKLTVIKKQENRFKGPEKH